MKLETVSSRHVTQKASVFALIISLAACSGGPAPQTYDLSPLNGTVAGRSAGSGQIIIYEPNVIALFDSERIVIRGSSQGFTYLPGAQWADRLPKLVQSRLIQSFENSSRYKSVGRPGDHISASALLTTDIRAFQIDEQTREAFVEISAKLVGQGSGRIETAQVFIARAPVGTIDGAGASAALDVALRQVLSQIVSWSSRR